jgi:NitT/TauT family transport system permease protein
MSIGRKTLKTWLKTLVGIIGLVVGGKLALDLLQVPEYVIPPPMTILHGLVEYRALLLKHLVPTLFEVFSGFVIGNCVAFAVAGLFIHNSEIRRILVSFSLFLRSIPIIALTPVLTLWLGLFLAPKVAIVALLTFFPTLVVTMHGLTSVDPLILDMMSVLNASRRETFVKVRIPASAPYVFSGLKIAAPSAVSAALVAEWLGSRQGIGHLMAVATFEFRTALLWATIVVAACLGILSFTTVGLLQRWLAPWSLGGSD